MSIIQRQVVTRWSLKTIKIDFPSIIINKRDGAFNIFTWIIECEWGDNCFFRKFSPISEMLHFKSKFGISIENASKGVQTCLCSVEWFLRQTVWYFHKTRQILSIAVYLARRVFIDSGSLWVDNQVFFICLYISVQFCLMG